jgi:hypothetical protein
MAKRIMFTSSVSRASSGYGGNAWASLQYPIGFRRLGFEVYCVEFLKANECKDDREMPVPFALSANARYFRTVMERFHLLDHAALLESEGPGHIGLSHGELEKLAPEIDLLINGSGVVRQESILHAVRRRLYLDVDPGYTQIWQQQYGVDMNLRGHDLYVTVGLNLGKPDCPLPTCGIDWHHILPPVVLTEWTTDHPPGPAYSTVADWRGFYPVEWRGVWYGQKADEFLRLIDLPCRVSVPLEMCLYIHSDELDRAKLEGHGWRLVSPGHHVTTPDTYRDYIFGSRGEFTAVKQGYAAGRTGWFSDRSACYLAAGRPVIIQDTGIGAYVPTGTGLLTFTDIDSAAEAINNVESDYSRHAAAAAAFAREFLDSDLVLSRLLQLAGI